MDRYCGSTFWETNLTWNTTDPDFTECFEHTALLWPVCGFLWLAALFDLSQTGQPSLWGSGVPPWLPGWSRIGIFKMVNVGILIGLQVATLRFVNLDHHGNDNSIPEPDVYWTSPIILIATHFLSASLIIFHKTKCVHTSGIQLIHWFLLSLVTGLMFRTKYRSSYLDHHPEPERDLPQLVFLGLVFSMALIQSFLFCWSDIPKSGPEGRAPLIEPRDDDDDVIEREPCPVLRVSILNHFLFSWATPLVRQGNQKPLTHSDLWDLLPSLRAQPIHTLFSKYYGKPAFGEIRSIYRNILKPLWRTCGGAFLIGVFFKIINSLASFLPPKLMGYLIDFVKDDTIQAWKGYMWAASLFLIYILVTLSLEQFYLYMFHCYLSIKNCLTLAIYRKSLYVSHEGRKNKTNGEIVNLMSVDSEKVQVLVYNANDLLGTPIQLGVGIILLWLELGVALLPGIGVICSIIPINWWLTRISEKYRRAEMAKKDERIKMLSEVLGGIQAIKLYAWEPSFQSEIQKIRADEIRILKKRAVAQCLMTFVFDSLPFLVSIAAFFTYIYMSGEALDPKKAFTSVALFNLLTDPITNLPYSIAALVDCTVSFRRISNFLNAEEVDPDATTVEVPGDLQGAKEDSLPAVEISDGNFAWEDLSDCNWQLNDIDLTVKPGELTAIVGRVGSGKSSLLSAILGNMKHAGEVIVRGRIAYTSQIAWILNTTLRENICFGLPYEQEKYDKIIDACCLGPDLEILQAGDMTEIGEKGINLSGGQKQRVSLARLAYSGADILLLDDVLSAVDSHVGKHIFERLLGPSGILSGRTRILCTHAYNFLSQMDKVVLLDGGSIIESGSYKQLMEDGGKLSRLIADLEQTCNNDEGEDEKTTTKAGIPNKCKEDGKLIEEEELQTGDVDLSAYLGYVRAMGYSLTIGFVSFLFLSEGLSLARNMVLSKWTEASGNGTGNGSWSESGAFAGQSSYAIQYATLGIAQSLFYLFGFGLLAIVTLRATNVIHDSMLKRILRAPMSFFHVTPLGRIVNRFSSDVETMDREIPSNIGSWICNIFKFCAILIAVGYANMYFIVVIIPLIIVYYFLQRYYIVCMQQLQRIVNAHKSPIYAQFQETLNGTATVRAYGAEARFTGMLSQKLENYIIALWPHLIVRRWLSIRLGILGSVVVLIPALFAVVWRTSTDPSLVGFSISYGLQFVEILSWLVKVTSYLQYNFVSVERILEYSTVVQEAAFETGEGHPHQLTGKLTPNWPEKGSITFHNYETRYRPNLDLVLRSFSCTINPGEKIGIVGRTGAGKSSLTLALFRIIEGVTGQILIDGVNIARIGLRELRGRLTVIPQDPVLFSRSLRLNLDPFEEYGDDKLWEALRLAHLNQFVEGLEEGLEYPVSEGGENLSVGQRQLVCLARAILRRSSVLVLDEATASVDSATDELIQQTIREHFVGCTILNVAHRLKTVLDSSRVLVLGRGEVLEFDTPQALLADPNSHFYGMAKDAGVV